jgi:hypothetical protein
MGFKMKTVNRNNTATCVEKESVVGQGILAHQYDKETGNQGKKGSPVAKAAVPRTGKGCQPTSVKGCM